MLGLERGCARVRLETLDGGEAERFYVERGLLVVARLPRWREERDFVVMERAPQPAPGSCPSLSSSATAATSRSAASSGSI